MTTIYALAFCYMVLGGGWECRAAEPVDSLAACKRMLANFPEGDRPYAGVNGGRFKWSCAAMRVPAWELAR